MPVWRLLLGPMPGLRGQPGRLRRKAREAGWSPAWAGWGPGPGVRLQHDRGHVFTGLSCQAELVTGGGVHQSLPCHIHQELVGEVKIHPQDGEGHVRVKKEAPLKGAAW